MAGREAAWSLLVATALGGVLAFVPAYWTVARQIEAARATDLRNSRVTALQAYLEACIATVEDDRFDGILVAERLGALSHARTSSKEVASIDARYDKHRDEAELHWSLMIAKRYFANLIFDQPLPLLDLSQEDTSFDWDTINAVKAEAVRLRQHGDAQNKRCKEEITTLAQKLKE